jgi:O-methyltransferase
VASLLNIISPAMTYPDLSALSGFPGWQAARVPRAPGPGPELETMRRAYLELLKLALCDLTGTSTVSVGKWLDGSVSSREIAGENLRLRAAGMDWPMQGLTMVGLNRLDDLQECVETVVRDAVPGDVIEAGSWRGGASILMRATLDSLGERGRTSYVADSFQGFPRADDQGHLNQTDFLAIPVEEVRANFARFGLDHDLEFVVGYFEETLPRLADRRWSVIRLDGDTYEATWTTLASLYGGLEAGGYVIVDDFRAMPECGRAVEAFREYHRIAEPVEDVDWTCVRWRKESEAPLAASPPAADAPAARLQPPERAVVGRPPSERELELEAEVAALREQLAAAEGAAARRPSLRRRRTPR